MQHVNSLRPFSVAIPARLSNQRVYGSFHILVAIRRRMAILRNIVTKDHFQVQAIPCGIILLLIQVQPSLFRITLICKTRGVGVCHPTFPRSIPRPSYEPWLRIPSRSLRDFGKIHPRAVPTLRDARASRFEFPFSNFARPVNLQLSTLDFSVGLSRQTLWNVQIRKRSPATPLE